MVNIAIIEKYPTSFNYKDIFDFKFDQLCLINNKQDKILKKDIQLDIDKCKELYDYIILIGKEPCKFVADIRSVVEYQGYLYDKKYLALINPIAVKLNPSLKDSFEKAISDIKETINGKEEASNFTAIGISEEVHAFEYLSSILSGINSGEIDTIAIDTETSSLYPRDGYVLGISLSTSEDTGVYIDSLAMSDDNILILQQILDKINTIVFFNKKFDAKMLKYHYNLKFDNSKCHDAMLQHYNLDENSGHGLKELCLKYTDLGDYDRELDTFKREYCKNHKIYLKDFTYDLIPFEILSKYAGFDAGGTLILHNKFYPIIKNNRKLLNVYEDILLRGSDFLEKIEENGIPISIDILDKESNIIINQLKELTDKLYTYEEVKQVEAKKGALFNVNSPAHVSYLLFEVLNLPIVKLTATGNASADAETLETYAETHELAALINEIKQLKKIKATYLDKMKIGVDSDGRLRTNFNLHTVTSGRLSSSGKINAQQLPRKNKAPKNAICAREGYKIVSQDLKTAEMYVAAVLSGDKNLQQIFIDKVDYHGAMAIKKFKIKDCLANDVEKLFPELRQEAKTISFEILYKLNYQEEVLAAFPKLKKWLREQELFIKQHGYIYSIFGRKRRLKDAFSPDKETAQHIVRSGINFLVQSVASDINLLAGIDMMDWIIENGYQEVMKIFGLVHDSILAEVKDEYIELYTKKLAEFTQKDRGVSIPNCPIGLDVEVGQSYGTVKRI